jgi:putative tricarboxylic transport membrane protein
MGGNFIPLMSLGVPSTPIMAILLAAMVIVGVTPGPLLIKTSPTLFWGVVASMYIGNIMLLILNLPLIPMWVKILKIPYSYLFSFILLFIAIGAYSLNNNVMDIFIAIAFGILGYFMNKFGYELPPFVLGLVLGPIIEVSLRRSLILSHGSFTIFMTRPISACFLIIVALLAALLLITRKHLGAGLQREE